MGRLLGGASSLDREQGEARTRERVSAKSSAELLFKEHFGMVWRNLRRLGVEPASLDDAAQDVFVVVHRRIRDLESETVARSWVFGITLRVASSYRRRQATERSRQSSSPLELESTDQTISPEHVYERREAREVLSEILSRLPEAERDVLVCVELEQMTVPETAKLLGFNTNTTYTRLRQGRIRFNDLVERRPLRRGQP
jgi:RNA polymerase sigma-70 factor (ECF subfamily)